jgi:hypothetical protein
MTATIHTFPSRLVLSNRFMDMWRALSPDTEVGYTIEGPRLVYVADTFAESYIVKARRQPIGQAATLKEAQALAQRHCDQRPR